MSKETVRRRIREQRSLGDKIDSTSPAFVDASLREFDGRIPLSVTSLWRDFDSRGELHGKVIPLEYYRIHADVLLPRAVAYSTGLIDFFFRGKLEVGDPDQGLVAVIDQAVPHRMVDGYPRRLDSNAVVGFERLRLSVKNTTPSITETGTGRALAQGMAHGLLVAVARYHRNPCYLPSLQGELVKPDGGAPASIPSGACTIDQTRTSYEEVSVSAPFALNSALPSDQRAQFAFDFSADPIPVNVTDLVVQIIYRGQLGAERDGIAVGRLDLPEPYFLSELNSTDYYYDGDRWIATAPGTDAPWPAVLENMTVSWADDFNATTWGLVASALTPLPTGRFLRLAVIGRSAPGKLRLSFDVAQHGHILRETLSPYSPTTRRQATTEEISQGEYQPQPLLADRGMIANFPARYFIAFFPPQVPRSTLPPVIPEAAPDQMVVSPPY